jgi:phenylacetic acid degradation operon negative regulatory protein
MNVVTTPSARSLILDLLSTLRRGAMPVRALVAAGELFGITPNSLRVGLARLCSTGQVERDARGSYRLGAAARAIDGHVQSWRRAHERMRPWTGSQDGGGGHWIGVLAPAGRSRRGGAADARALRLHGFRELQPGLFVRPDNLIEGVRGVRRSLLDVGLAPARGVLALSELDEVLERRARVLWHPDALPEQYRRTRERLEASERQLPSLPIEAAMVESFLLGGRAIRTITLDPLLPPPIVEEGALAALVAATQSYDRAGRACWAAFLERHGVVHRHAPVDARVGDAARALPTAPSSPVQKEGALA